MDFLQIALIFLIFLISIFLGITGIQVFLILRDLHKNLKRLDKILETSQEIATDIEKPARMASEIASGIETGGKVMGDVARAITGVVRNKVNKPQKPRFYKKIMK